MHFSEKHNKTWKNEKLESQACIAPFNQTNFKPAQLWIMFWIIKPPLTKDLNFNTDWGKFVKHNSNYFRCNVMKMHDPSFVFVLRDCVPAVGNFYSLYALNALVIYMQIISRKKKTFLSATEWAWAFAYRTWASCCKKVLPLCFGFNLLFFQTLANKRVMRSWRLCGTSSRLCLPSPSVDKRDAHVKNNNHQDNIWQSITHS